MHIHELSKELGVSSEKIIKALQAKGFAVQDHMTMLTDEMFDFITTHYENAPSLEDDLALLEEKEEKIKRLLESDSADDPTRPKSRYKRYKRGPRKERSAHHRETVVVAQDLPKTLTLETISLGDLADRIGQPANELILFLLKKGIVCAKNQLLPVTVVEEIAAHYAIKTVAPAKKDSELVKSSVGGKGDVRPPIVVVIGHVDHGKTTLLDFIRKTRVAAKEKGGITQHLGAYTVPTSHGNIVFLDTPGHEAFSRIRVRGLKTADIAILIIAADDGVMPQTVEAIKAAQEAQIPLVVAINKADKASPSQIETVKRQLAQHSILVEDWGGEVTALPISALTGQGVDQLLEILALQAEILELRADSTLPARGFILEARMEKGRGAVATVILQEGSLAPGKYFVCGDTFGKVTSLIDEHGKNLSKVMPAMPVQISGFDQLPEAGDVLHEVDQREYSQVRSGKKVESAVEMMPLVSTQSLNIIVKADNKSSKEALLAVLQKLNKAVVDDEIHVISSSVGNITERDINLAADTKAIIYGFNVKFEPMAEVIAKKKNIDIRIFDIIYKLTEDLEALIESRKKQEMVLKVVGEAEVRKVFNIKNLGVIAGSYVKDGHFVRNGLIEVWRAGKKLGQFSLKSLERDRNSVKEVAQGFEFAFLTEGFNDWQVGDIAKCIVSVKA